MDCSHRHPLLLLPPPQVLLVAVTARVSVAGLGSKSQDSGPQAAGPHHPPCSFRLRLDVLDLKTEGSEWLGGVTSV